MLISYLQKQINRESIAASSQSKLVYIKEKKKQASSMDVTDQKQKFH